MRTKPQSCLGFVFLNTWDYHKSNTIAVLKKNHLNKSLNILICRKKIIFPIPNDNLKN